MTTERRRRTERRLAERRLAQPARKDTDMTMSNADHELHRQGKLIRKLVRAVRDLRERVEVLEADAPSEEA